MSNYRIIEGDVRNVLKTLPDKHVQCVVTSPPYFGLRNYGMSEQVGLEKTPQEYVQNMVELFREVRRVLRDDGTVFLNLGDSYAGSGPSGASYQSKTTKRRSEQTTDGNFRISKSLDARGLSYAHKKPVAPVGLKPKDLMGIPWRVAFALQDDGWYLRSDIIWHKPNPMPESTKDRPTKSHEYIFLLTKQPKYYYDHEAIKEVATYAQGTMRFSEGTSKARKMKDGNNEATDSNHRSRPYGRNRRSVWTITPQPYKGSHFATFPEEIPQLCILAGTSAKGCCAVCGRAYVRINGHRAASPDIQKIAAGWGAGKDGQYHGQAIKTYEGTGAQNASDVKRRILENLRERRTIGWQRKCRCEPAETKRIVPCVVMDIFNGSGTTGAVALHHGREYIGIELNPEYIQLAHQRIRQGVRKVKKPTVKNVDEPSLPI